MINLRNGVLSMLAAGTLAGCSSQSLTLGSNDPCTDLKAVVADYPSGFSDFRGKANQFNLLTIYAAKRELIEGHCEIWAWNQADAAYVCTANAPNVEVADARWEKADRAVSQCLGDSWQRQEQARTRDEDAAGHLVRYTLDGTPAVISIHSIIRKGGPRDRLSTSLYVGSPARVNELTQ